MFISHSILEDLGLVLCVAALTTVIFQLIRQPVVVGYLIAGMIVGPHVMIPLLADSDRIHTLSELGVILLMFALGLEFSIRKLIRLGPTAGFVTAMQVGLMMWLGYVTGRAMGWTELEGIFAGAMLSISSTTIVAKAFDEIGNIGQRLRDLVFGVLLAEDLTAVIMLAVLTALASGAGLSAAMMLTTVGKLALFLILLAGGGLLIVPWMVRKVVRIGRPETTLVASVGICFAFAIIAELSGYSVALGGFLAGSLVAESGEVEAVEHLIKPVRDIFAAVFFVSVGMMINPALIAEHWVALTVLVLVVIVGKLVAVTLASLLSGVGVRTSVQAGMSLTQIGEFSFIIGGVGLATHATRNFLYTLAVAVSAITTFTTPFMIMASVACSDFISRRLPADVNTLQVLYDALMERMRHRAVSGRAILRPIALLAIGVVAIAAILITDEMDFYDLVTGTAHALGIDTGSAILVVDFAALIVCIPFIAAMYFGSRGLARTLVVRTLTSAANWEEKTAESGSAEALASMLQATLLTVTTVPLLAFVQPFMDSEEGVAVILIGIMLMGIVIWRSARKMRGQMASIRRLLASALVASESKAVPQEVPGLGMLTPIRLKAGASAIGRTLTEIDLRGSTGATAIAIARGTDGVIVPSGTEVLQEGDVIGLAGSAEVIEAARRMLVEPHAQLVHPVA